MLARYYCLNCRYQPSRFTEKVTLDVDYNVICKDLFQPKMSPTLSFYGMYQKSFIYCRNRNNSQ